MAKKPTIYFPSPNAIKVFEAVHKAQEVLASHIEPGGPSAPATINKLLGILDDHRLVRALELAHPQGRRYKRKDGITPPGGPPPY